MFNYIKSEFYRIIHSKASYLFIAVCSLLLVSSNVVLAVVKQTEDTFIYANTSFSFSNVYSSFIIVYILCIMVSGMIFGNEHNNHTFKNCVSFGISRGTIYFGKLFTQVVYAVLAFTLIIGVHVGSAYLLLEDSGIDSLLLLLRTSFAVLPLLFTAIAVANCFYFIIDSYGGAIAASSVLMIGLPLTCGMLGMKFDLIKKFSDILPWNLINSIAFDFKKNELFLFWEKNGYVNYWLAGIIQMLIMAVLGYILFRKKEVK